MFTGPVVGLVVGAVDGTGKDSCRTRTCRVRSVVCEPFRQVVEVFNKSELSPRLASNHSLTGPTKPGSSLRWEIPTIEVHLLVFRETVTEGINVGGIPKRVSSTRTKTRVY